MKPLSVNGLNVLKGVAGILPDFNSILKGIYYLATAKPEKCSSIGSIFEKRSKQLPDKCFLKYQNTQYSYREFNEWANQISHYLQSQGIKSGDTIAVMMENRPETIACVLAITKLGAIVSMINTTQKEEVLLHSLNTVKIHMAIVGEECTDAFNGIKDQIISHENCSHCFYKDTGEPSTPEGFIDLDKVIENQPLNNLECTAQIKMQQPAYYIFTSGTTGLPKASILTHFRWIKAMAAFGLSAFRIRRDDVYYVCLPLYHNNALTVSWASIVGAGATMALSRKFSASGFWDDCRKFEVTAFCYIGELCRYLLNQPPKENDQDHKVRVIGGNGLRPDIWMAFRERFGIKQIMELYGASECNIAFVNLLNLDMTAGFCPMSYSVVEYDIENDCPILNSKGFMIPVKTNQTGLLIAQVTDRSPYEGYTNASENNKKILSNVFKKGDLYFHSGDLVQQQGYRHVAFVDRLGDTFRWKGENVATTEVEEVTNMFNDINQSVVYGVQVPNTDGRAGMAAISLNTDILKFDFDGFSKHLFAKLPSYAIPLFIRIRKEQDITGTFKYKKGDLKQEGINIEAFDEPVYVLNNDNQYIPLCENTLSTIRKQGLLQAIAS